MVFPSFFQFKTHNKESVMKVRRFLLSSAVLMLASGFCCCNSDSESGIQVRTVANTGCKSAETRGEDGLPWPEYIEYKAMEDGYLSIKHINTMFNCYVKLTMEATVSGNEIQIIEKDYSETEDGPRSNCICTYDLYCEVGPLTTGTYTVVISTHRSGYEKARFTISYAKGLDGKYVIREQQQAKEETHDDTKMLVNGRTWNYMSVYYNVPTPDTVYHSSTIEGPVEFDGRQCYRIVQGTNKYFYEEGDKVYAYKIVSDKGEYGWKEEFNFGIEPGYKETVTVDGVTLTVRECKAADTIVDNGVQRRRLKFGHDIWVEGIGSSKSGIYSSWGEVIGTFMGSKLLSVYDGEKCMFTEEDFKDPQ